MPTERGPRAVAIIIGLIAVVLTAVVLTGCGSSSSGGGSSVTGSTGSSTAGASTAVVRGQVLTTRGASGQEPMVAVLLRTALGIGLAEAAPGDVPLVGATVKISSATFTATAITDDTGGFVIPNVPPGVYTVEVNGVLLVGTTIVVGVGDVATVAGVVTQNTITGIVTVVAADTTMNDTQLGHAMNIDRASAICDLPGVIQRRQQRIGWGVIARECGVHPGVLGLGRSNLTDGEIADAREGGGRGRGHGPGGPGGKGNSGKNKT